jgi:hypothetical protein
MCSKGYAESFVLYRVLVSAKEKFGYGFYGNDIVSNMIVKKSIFENGSVNHIYCSVPLDFLKIINYEMK